MTLRAKRTLLRVALVASAPSLLATAILCLSLSNAVNPMQLSFITAFDVENRTNQPVWITPVGTTHSGSKHVLPQFARQFAAIPAWRSVDHFVEAGEERRIYYDWDDINWLQPPDLVKLRRLG